MTLSAATTGPGTLLRQRRESLGLTLEQAAAQLNLKTTVISQLESGQWDPQVAPTFIRGYLRHYVRLLKLDEAELLAQFDQQLAALPQAATMHSFSNKASREAAESRFMLATYFLVVLLIGLFLIWFWQTHMLNEQPVAVLPEGAPSAIEQPVVQEKTAVRIQSDEVAGTATNAGLNPDVVNPPTADATLVQPQAASDTASLSADGAQTALPAPTANPDSATIATAQPASAAVVTTTSESTELSQPVTESPTSTEGATATQAVAANAAATVQLDLQFTAQCWVAVTDATGKRLAYSMQNGGQSLTLTGTAPLKVTFGDPTAVTASLSGKAIDLSGYKQGQVVRLTLTGSE